MTGGFPADPPARARPRLTVLPLIALIFYDVSGGPFGIEDSVHAGGGALLAVLGFLVLPNERRSTDRKPQIAQPRSTAAPRDKIVKHLCCIIIVFAGSLSYSKRAPC